MDPSIMTMLGLACCRAFDVPWMKCSPSVSEFWVHQKPEVAQATFGCLVQEWKYGQSDLTLVFDCKINQMFSAQSHHIICFLLCCFFLRLWNWNTFSPPCYEVTYCSRNMETRSCNARYLMISRHNSFKSKEFSWRYC